MTSAEDQFSVGQEGFRAINGDTFYVRADHDAVTIQGCDQQGMPYVTDRFARGAAKALAEAILRAVDDD